MDVKKRQYYFDGRSVLLDQYDESSKFDQNFDESDNLYRSTSNNFYQSNLSNKLDKNVKKNKSPTDKNIVQEHDNEENYGNCCLNINFFYFININNHCEQITILNKNRFTRLN